MARFLGYFLLVFPVACIANDMNKVDIVLDYRSIDNYER